MRGGRYQKCENTPWVNVTCVGFQDVCFLSRSKLLAVVVLELRLIRQTKS